MVAMVLAAQLTPTDVAPASIPVRLVASVSVPHLRAADAAELTVPAVMGRKALRDLLHHLLHLAEKPVEERPDFHFLVSQGNTAGQPLRTTLAKFIAKRNFSTEAATVLTYYLPIPDPTRPDPVSPSVEWLSSIDVRVIAGGKSLLLAGSYSGIPSISTPSAVLVSEAKLRDGAHAAPIKAVAWIGEQCPSAFVSAGLDEVAKLWTHDAASNSASVCAVFRSDDVAHPTSFEAAAATTVSDKTLVALGATDGSVWVLDDIAERLSADGAPEAMEEAETAENDNAKRKHVDVPSISSQLIGTTSKNAAVTRVRWQDGSSGALVSAGYDGMVRMWDVDAGIVKLSIPAGGKALTGLALSGINGTAVVAAVDGAVRLVDSRDGKGVVASSTRGKAHDGMATDVAWMMDGASFVSGGLDGSVRVWDLRGLEAPVHVVEGVHGARNVRSLSLGVAATNGRTTVFSAGEDGRLQAVAFDM
jgi:WD40 repeat protein